MQVTPATDKKPHTSVASSGRKTQAKLASAAFRIQRRAACQKRPPPFVQQLLLINKMSTPVLLPARFVVLGAEGLLLAIADGLDVIGRNAILNQRIFGCVGAVVAQGQVVFGGAALVAVALDGDFDVRVLLQKVGVTLNCRLLIRADIVLIVVEVDILHVLVE